MCEGWEVSVFQGLLCVCVCVFIYVFCKGLGFRVPISEKSWSWRPEAQPAISTSRGSSGPVKLEVPEGAKTSSFKPQALNPKL